MIKNKLSIRKRWSEKMSENKVTISINDLYAKKEKTYRAYVLKLSNCEKICFNDSKMKKDNITLQWKNYRYYYEEQHQKIMFVVWIVFIILEQKAKLNCIKKYVKIKTSVM